jgi:serine/threonine protein kinase
MYFGPYEIISDLATGGMSEVYLARPAGNDDQEERVVIKRILPSLASDPTFVELFQEEARISRLMKHVNVVRVLDSGEVEGAPYIAMEYVDGLDCWRMFHRCAARGIPTPPHLAIYVVSQVLRGLAYVHNASDESGQLLKVVHGDVSPTNVYISSTGEVKLGDFGIARSRHQAETTGSPAMRGKVAYLAPEQVRGEEADYRADLFAAGTVLAELLIQSRLFGGGSQLTTLLAIRDVRLDVLESNLDKLPEGTEAVLRRALARTPTERYPSAMSMCRALERSLRKQRADKLKSQLAQLVSQAQQRKTSMPPAPMRAPLPGPYGRPTRGRRPGDDSNRTESFEEIEALDELELIEEDSGGLNKSEETLEFEEIDEIEEIAVLDEHDALDDLPDLPELAAPPPEPPPAGPQAGPHEGPHGAPRKAAPDPLDQLEDLEGMLAYHSDLDKGSTTQGLPADFVDQMRKAHGNALDGRPRDQETAQVSRPASQAPPLAAFQAPPLTYEEPTHEAPSEFFRQIVDDEQFVQEEIEIDLDEDFIGGSAPAARKTAPPEVVYLFRRADGTAVGPVSYPQAVAWMVEDRIRSTYEVSVSGGPFRLVREVPELIRHAPALTPATTEAPSVGPPDRRGLLHDEPAWRVLFDLALARDTGVAIFDHGSVRKEVYLANGQLHYVTSNLSSERLGETLVARGVIDEAELDRALGVLARYSGHLGDALVGMNLVEPLKLFHYITEQVQDKFMDIFAWSKGEYQFYRGVENPDAAFPLHLDTMCLLWDGISRGVESRTALTWLRKKANWLARPEAQHWRHVGALGMPSAVVSAWQDQRHEISLSRAAETATMARVGDFALGTRLLVDLGLLRLSPPD